MKVQGFFFNTCFGGMPLGIPFMGMPASRRQGRPVSDRLLNPARRRMHLSRQRREFLKPGIPEHLFPEGSLRIYLFTQLQPLIFFA